MPKLTRTSLSIKDLTDMYASGEIAIPEIQRDFVWDSQRIRSLLDSVYRDYPSGAVILWRPKFSTRSEFEMFIRPERLHRHKERLPTYLLLDGQQRLTALCSVILPVDEVLSSLGEEIDLPKLFIHLKKLGIEARRDTVPSSNNEVLLNRLLSLETDDSGLSSVLNELAPRKDISPKHKNALKEFRDRILQYSYPVQSLENHDYKTVADIFKRVNSQGKILVTAELVLATIVPSWKGFSKHLRSFMREMRSDGFQAELSFYLKCLAFIATDWPVIDKFSNRIVRGDFTTYQLEKYWQETQRAIRRLNSILKNHKIDRTGLITSRNALIPIVYAIAKDKRKRLKESLCVRWLIYSMDGGHYSQRTEAVLRRDSYPLTSSLPRIERGFAKLFKQMIQEDLRSTTFDEIDFEGAPAKNPYMLFMYLCLRHQGAKDFHKTNAVDLNEISALQIHHVFPVEYMLGDDEAEDYRKRKGLRRQLFKEQINDIANLTFLSLETNQEIKKRPAFDYLPKLTTPKNLAAHCIPRDPELWRPLNFDKFCAERRRLLARAMNSYLRHLE